MKNSPVRPIPPAIPAIRTSTPAAAARRSARAGRERGSGGQRRRGDGQQQRRPGHGDGVRAQQGRDGDQLSGAGQEQRRPPPGPARRGAGTLPDRPACSGGGAGGRVVRGHRVLLAGGSRASRISRRPVFPAHLTLSRPRPAGRQAAPAAEQDSPAAAPRSGRSWHDRSGRSPAAVFRRQAAPARSREGGAVPRAGTAAVRAGRFLGPDRVGAEPGDAAAGVPADRDGQRRGAGGGDGGGAGVDQCQRVVV